MSDSTSNKKYPQTTPEVAKMFGIHADEDTRALPVIKPEPEANKSNPGFSKIVGNLYIKDLPKNEAPAHSQKSQHKPEQHKPADTKVEATKHVMVLQALRSITPYLAIFSIGLFLYFFFFTNIDFSSAFKFQIQSKTPQQSALEQLQNQSLAEYQNWISQFYYHVSDQKVLDPNADNSGNGLTNFQKYLLNLNPKSYDTANLGMADSEALAKGINPLSGTPLNDNQKQLLEKYFDMEVIMNRLALSQMQRQASVAGASIYNSGNNANPATQPAAPGLSSLDINTGVPGRLEIPDLKINVPVIWTSDVKNFDRDLRSGVVHYPGTAMPGQIGTTYISGHSSNYVWAKGEYNNIFAHLNDLPDNASFKITFTLKNGKQTTLNYAVTGRQQYDPKDQAQFKNSAQSVVALSTCWPVGSTAKRLVVFGQLMQTNGQ